MDRQLLRLFLWEVEMQCRFVLIGAEQLAQARADTERRDRTERSWYALQSILVSAANISKLLWGSGKQDAPREKLREALAVQDESCLHSPDLRNDFEHFDERLESVYGDEQPRGFAGRSIVDDDSFLQYMPSQHFGHYNPSSGDVTFWDHSVNVRGIVAEIEQLVLRIEALRFTDLDEL